MWPLQDAPPVEDIEELLRTAVDIYELLPLFVWLIIGMGAIIAIQWVWNRFQTVAEVPGDDTIDRRRQETRVPREKYTIHDDVDVGQYEYREPSESDEITTQNEVNRGLFSTIRSLVDLMFRRGGERE